MLSSAACSGGGDEAGPSTPPTTTATPSATPTASPRVSPTSPAPSAARTTTPAPSGPADPLASSPPLETAPPVGVPTCTSATLSAADADVVYTAAAAQELFSVRTSGPDCQLQGYPTVQLLDAAGAPLAVTVGQGGFDLPAPAAAPITLSRSTSLSFFVATARDGTCVPASTLVVTLPGSGGPVRAATAMRACGSAVGVGPVQRLGDVD